MAAEASSDTPAAANALEDAPTQAIASSVKRRARGTVQSENDDGSPPRKKPRTESVEDVESEEDSDNSADEGEVDSEGASKETTVPPLDGQAALRTSFATSVPKRLNPDMAMHTPITPEDRALLIDGLRDGESKTTPPVNKRSTSWPVPPIRADAIVGSTWLAAVNSALDAWCTEFLANNRHQIDEYGMDAKILKGGFLKRLEKHVVSIPDIFTASARQQLKAPGKRLKKFKADFQPGSRKAAKKQAKKEAKEAKMAAQQQQQAPSHAHTPAASSTRSPAVQSSTSTDAITDDGLEEGERMETDTETDNGTDGAGQVFSPDELELRQRYYPGLPSRTPFCLACASLGHSTAGCPEAKCKFCQDEHFTYQCPSRQRCEKCKQLGHNKSSCKEKLAVAPGEGFMECAFCEGQDHEENNCTELWQTYRPRTGPTKKVKQLPIFCYCCGAQGHYGSDCGLADTKVPPCETWTAAYASMYLDSESSELPIADKNPPPPPPEDSKPIIPGRSIKPQSHIIFEESDDDGETFFRAPAAASASAGAGPAKSAKSIQIKSNITFGGGSSGATAPAPPPPPPSAPPQQDQQAQQTPKRKPRRAAAQQALAIINAPPPPPRPGTGKYPLRSGKQPPGGPGNKARGQQQPPLPPGPPPSNSRKSNGGGGRGRGRGGFSNLGRRGRGGGGRGGNNR